MVADAACCSLMKFDDECRLNNKRRHIETVRFVNFDSDTAKAFHERFRKYQESVSRVDFVPGVQAGGQKDHEVESTPVDVAVLESSHTDRHQTDPASSRQDYSIRSSSPVSLVPYVGDRLNFRTSTGIDVEICRQNLLSEKVDAIVCSVDCHLTLGGGAAAAVAAAAGSELRQSCAKFIDKHGALKIGEVTHSEAGSLKPSIKYVILAAGPSAGMFPDDRQLDEVLIGTFFNTMLYANDRLQVHSVSIPAISSGKFGVKQIMRKRGQ
jgi:O-acetyl-ADP-ribose deacetylase (regulator of RNase III)